jgi:hypothetical protein
VGTFGIDDSATFEATEARVWAIKKTL